MSKIVKNANVSTFQNFVRSNSGTKHPIVMAQMNFFAHLSTNFQAALSHFKIRLL